MSPNNNNAEEMRELLAALREDTITESQGDRLTQLLRDDRGARRTYIHYMAMVANIRGRIADRPIVVEMPANDLQLNIDTQTANPLFPSLSTTHYPLPANFVGGPVFSYMVASVVLCLMLLSAWAYKITHVLPSTPDMANSRLNQESPMPAFVGKITGMKDCRWVDEALGTMVGASVPGGREYALDAGLLEITYTSGARIILEGPCEYRVESNDGGYLGRGKLTARIEKREERGEKSDGLAASAARAKPQAVNPQPPTPNPQSPIPLFSVTTPSAIVTDLGTEFGVEVGENGSTLSLVFSGTVKVATSDGMDEVVLRIGQSALVEKGDDTGVPHLAWEIDSGRLPKFVRRMAPLPKKLDLLDIVSGGNGRGHRRERGIDPATGREDSFFIMKAYHGADDYQPIVWHSLIDGIFVPKRHATTAQLDSAGHTFDGFDFGTGGTVGSIWARAAEVKPIKKEQNRWTWVYTMASADRFMPSGGGLLCLHANAGITFDLAAMRKMFDGARPSRFRATAGMATPGPKLPNPYGKADLWVFADGRLMQSQKGVQIEDEAISFDVELGPEDRFLTLVSTDARNGCNYDWVVFGEPILEMTSTDTEAYEENRP